ncbi:hypothetical protein ACFL0Q_05445 [Thermodesulfobacteriota bacterium]
MFELGPDSQEDWEEAVSGVHGDAFVRLSGSDGFDESDGLQVTEDPDRLDSEIDYGGDSTEDPDSFFDTAQKVARTAGKRLGILVLGLFAMKSVDAAIGYITVGDRAKAPYSISELYASEVAPIPDTVRVARRIMGREYTKVIKDADGKPVLKVEVKYLGKSADPNSTREIPELALKNSADFYNITFTNLTDNTIHFDSLYYWMEGTGELITKHYKTRQDIAKDIGTDTIFPNQSVEERNSFCAHTKAKYAKFHKEFTVMYKGRRISFDVPRIYIR